ncbi:hypothetical protein LOH54_04890 [Sulfurimonas sp. HSL-3221]|uniref:hypothetical protein n=1 Tax=Sulfurimonadaceae TaxID=2771471 RepID=UPI001E5AB31C|nr:hypothetical protein [Sulfurimonas sp. HSL-3221]UFS63468.1 hypothetical protein LOH54_04890 [Sulfurimonas sp. HSL-3221]
MLEIAIFSLIILVFGALPSLWYLRRRENVDDNPNPHIVIVVLTTLLVLTNTYFAYLMGQGSISYVLGYVFFIPLVVVLVSRNNWRARWNSAFFSSLVIFLSIIVNLITAADETAKQIRT